MIERGVEQRRRRVTPRSSAGLRVVEHLRVDVELGHVAADPQQKRQRRARLAQRRLRAVHGLVRLELRDLDALEVPFADRSRPVAILELLERGGLGSRHLLREPVRELRLRDLHVGGLHLEP